MKPLQTTSSLSLPKFNYTYKALNKAMGKALHRYHMIRDGDRIAIGFSGGKDSWALLWLLAERKKRAPVHYELFPLHIDLGFPGGSIENIQEHSHRMGFEIYIERTDYGTKAHSAINRENPCFLCSRLRRQRLFELANTLGCNKLALGHNKDDLIETFLLNICYTGEISTMTPCQPLFNGKLTLIRPLAYADEDIIHRFSNEMQWPVFHNPCPSAGSSKRAEIKKMLQQLYRSNKKIKGNIFRAMHRVKTDYLLK